MKAEVRSRRSEECCALAADGFEILPGALTLAECDALAEEISQLYEKERAFAKSKIGGVRNLLQNSSRAAKIACSQKVRDLLESRLGRKFFPVRALFFDKTAEANWSVPWHRDVSIAVVARIATDGFSAWSIKDGVVHVQPPCEILEQMVAIRLHLDDCQTGDGALRVIPGSHRGGRLDVKMIRETEEKTAVTCEVPRGGALIMRPLLLHSSGPAENPNHRRVLHIEYASCPLPNGLRWFYSP